MHTGPNTLGLRSGGMGWGKHTVTRHELQCPPEPHLSLGKRHMYSRVTM